MITVNSFKTIKMSNKIRKQEIRWVSSTKKIFFGDARMTRVGIQAIDQRRPGRIYLIVLRARHEVSLTHSLKKISPPDLLGARAQRSDGFSSL